MKNTTRQRRYLKKREGMPKKHYKREKLLCISIEQRKSSGKVGETLGNGEESPTFRGEP